MLPEIRCSSNNQYGTFYKNPGNDGIHQAQIFKPVTKVIVRKIIIPLGCFFFFFGCSRSLLYLSNFMN